MKKCINCGKFKELECYYKHKQMGDGHLNKCKECCKSQASVRESTLRATNPDWVEKDRKRGREKYHRLEYKGKYKPTYEKKKEVMDKYKEKYPEKIRATSLTKNIKPKVAGNELHHWSYNIGHEKSVIELSISNHNLAHRFMIYDQERMMYRTLDGELLDTKERHEKYINWVFENKE